MEIQSGYFGPRRSWLQRAVAAARLDVSVFEEVEADHTATKQAAAVVALSAVAQGIEVMAQGTGSIVGSILGSLLAWVIWSALTYFIGVTLFSGTATVGELLRTLGFAQAPGILFMFGLLPVIGQPVSLVITIWILIAGIIAIRQALDITTAKAVVTAIIGWLVLIIPRVIFGSAAFFSFR